MQGTAFLFWAVCHGTTAIPSVKNLLYLPCFSMTNIITVVLDICVEKVNELSRNEMIWTDEDGFLLKPLGMLGSDITFLLYLT